jgi:hypothetical protein
MFGAKIVVKKVNSVLTFAWHMWHWCAVGHWTLAPRTPRITGAFPWNKSSFFIKARTPLLFLDGMAHGPRAPWNSLKQAAEEVKSLLLCAVVICHLLSCLFVYLRSIWFMAVLRSSCRFTLYKSFEWIVWIGPSTVLLKSLFYSYISWTLLLSILRNVCFNAVLRFLNFSLQSIVELKSSMEIRESVVAVSHDKTLIQKPHFWLWNPENALKHKNSPATM